MLAYTSYMSLFAPIMYFLILYMSIFVSVCVDSYLFVPILMNVQPYISLPSLSCWPPVLVPLLWVRNGGTCPHRSTPPSFRSLMCALFIIIYLFIFILLECACRLVCCERPNGGNALVANKHLSHLHLCFVSWPGCERANWANALNPIHLSHQHL